MRGSAVKERERGRFVVPVVLVETNEEEEEDCCGGDSGGRCGIGVANNGGDILRRGSSHCPNADGAFSSSSRNSATGDVGEVARPKLAPRGRPAHSGAGGTGPSSSGTGRSGGETAVPRFRSPPPPYTDPNAPGSVGSSPPSDINSTPLPLPAMPFKASSPVPLSVLSRNSGAGTDVVGPNGGDNGVEASLGAR